MTLSYAQAPRLVILDRDGTINVAPEQRYIVEEQQLKLLPGAAAAIRRLNEAGSKVCIATNQQGVGKGLISLAQANAINDALIRMLSEQDARIDAVFMCPHLEGTCSCRKPRAGLIEMAAAAFDTPMSESVFIGDQPTDLAASEAAGVRFVGVGTQHLWGNTPNASDLLGAVELIVPLNG